MDKKLVGKITHYFPKVSVAVVELSATLNQGDKIVIEGMGQSFEQTIDSMEIEHKKVASAKKGQSIGLKVMQPVKEGFLVYKA